MDMGIYVLLERRSYYILAAEVQSDVEQAMRCLAANWPNAVIVPVTRTIIKAKFSPKEVRELGGQPAQELMARTIATD